MYEANTRIPGGLWRLTENFLQAVQAKLHSMAVASENLAEVTGKNFRQVGFEIL
jgi:hypothetical protein